MALKYSNPRVKAVIEDWPLGSNKRGSAIFSIEGTPRKGERCVRITTGKPKYLTYAVKQRIVDGDDGKTYIICLTIYGHISVFQGNMQYLEEAIFERDPRYAEVRNLFDEEVA
jgi:hypothetical protein